MAKKVRFMNNNLAELTGALSASSELAGFPVTNLIDKNRSTLWKADGHWLITASNKVLHVFYGGSPQTVTIDEGSYSTADLETEINAKLDAAAGAGVFSFGYDSVSFTWFFDTALVTATAVLFSNQTNAIWDTLGFLTTTNYPTSGGLLYADDIRIHTSEWIKVSLPSNDYQVDFAGLITQLGAVMEPSEAATIKLYGSNLDDIATATLILEVVRDDNGYLKGIDTETYDTYLQYWWFEIEDRTNPNGPASIQASQFYLGPSITFIGTNIARGFSIKVNDPSTISRTQTGRKFSNVRNKYTSFERLQIQLPTYEEMIAFKEFVKEFGLTEPFWISIDPLLCVSDYQTELSLYCSFDALPDFGHQFLKLYNILEFTVSEVV